MTPDESAWLGCVIAMLRAGETEEDAVASADDVLTRLRERREAGGFGPVSKRPLPTIAELEAILAGEPTPVICPKCERPAPLGLPHLCAPKPVRERLPDDVFESLVRHEGTWHEAGRPQNTAETQFAQEARRARDAERHWESKWLQATMRAKAAERALADVRADMESVIRTLSRERDEALTKMREAEAVALTHLNMRENAEAGMRNTAKRADAAESESAALRKVLHADAAWPLADVLVRLANAADHLLGGHDCDGHGWEEVDGCAKRARTYADQVRVLFAKAKAAGCGVEP